MNYGKMLQTRKADGGLALQSNKTCLALFFFHFQERQLEHDPLDQGMWSRVAGAFLVKLTISSAEQVHDAFFPLNFKRPESG
jgi:hypothetical protein